MPYQEDFAVEQFMDAYETGIQNNLGETCCLSLSLDEIAELSGEEFKLDTKKSLTYRDIRGSDPLRTGIAEMYGPSFCKENVLITNGAIGANFLLYYTLAGDGGHAICVNPTYSQLYSVPKMFGSEVDLLDLKSEDGFVPNMNTLKSMIKDNTMLIIINNPNNPLGSVISTELLIEICDLCKENNIYLHCDEVYRPIFHALPEGVEPPVSACELYDQAIVTGSMSKAFSVAGIRLGWMITKDLKVLDSAASRRDYNMISVSTIDDDIAQYVLKNRDCVIKRNFSLCRKNFSILKEFISNSNGKFELYNVPQGGTVCLLKIKGVQNTSAFGIFLAEKFQTLAVPGECFNTPGTIRIGYANSTPDIERGLKTLEEAYDEFTCHA